MDDAVGVTDLPKGDVGSASIESNLEVGRIPASSQALVPGSDQKTSIMSSIKPTSDLKLQLPPVLVTNTVHGTPILSGYLPDASQGAVSHRVRTPYQRSPSSPFLTAQQYASESSTGTLLQNAFNPAGNSPFRWGYFPEHPPWGTSLGQTVYSSHQIDLPSPDALTALLSAYFVFVAPHIPFIHPPSFLAHALKNRATMAFLLYTMLTLAAPFLTETNLPSQNPNEDLSQFDRHFFLTRARQMVLSVLESPTPNIQHVWGLAHLALASITESEPNLQAGYSYLGSAFLLAKQLHLDIETANPQPPLTPAWVEEEQNRRTYLVLWHLDRLIAGITRRSPMLDVSPVSALRAPIPDRDWIPEAFQGKPREYPGTSEMQHLLDITTMFASQEQRIEMVRMSLGNDRGEIEETWRWKVSECQKLRKYRESNPHLFPSALWRDSVISRSAVSPPDNLYEYAGRSLSVALSFYALMQHMLPLNDAEQRFQNARDALELIRFCLNISKHFDMSWADIGCPLAGFSVFSVAQELLQNSGEDRKAALDLVYAAIEVLDGTYVESAAQGHVGSTAIESNLTVPATASSGSDQNQPPVLPARKSTNALRLQIPTESATSVGGMPISWGLLPYASQGPATTLLGQQTPSPPFSNTQQRVGESPTGNRLQNIFNPAGDSPFGVGYLPEFSRTSLAQTAHSSDQIDLPSPDALTALLPAYFVYVAPHIPFIHPPSFLAHALNNRATMTFLLYTMLTLAAPFLTKTHLPPQNSKEDSLAFDRHFFLTRARQMVLSVLESPTPNIQHVWGLAHLALASITESEPNMQAANAYVGSAFVLAKQLHLDVEAAIPQPPQTPAWVEEEQNRRTYLGLWHLDRLIAGITRRSPMLDVSPVSALRAPIPDRDWIPEAFEGKPRDYPGTSEVQHLLDITTMFANQEQRIETIRASLGNDRGEIEETWRWKVSECQKLRRYREFPVPLDQVYKYGGRTLSLGLSFHVLMQRMIPMHDTEQRFHNARVALELVRYCLTTSKHVGATWVDLGCPLAGYSVFSLAHALMMNAGEEKAAAVDLVYATVEVLDG
ncbi:hypothetical protein HDU93_009095 [Gonapodya sp. JEL0774]|nr:hypothetical protein HDU93_009095 [Gonapodya sp. JEL0774]